MAGLRVTVRIDTNEADIEALDGRVTVNEDDIAANTTAIADEATAIASNMSSIGANTGMINDNRAAGFLMRNRALELSLNSFG